MKWRLTDSSRWAASLVMLAVFAGGCVRGWPWAQPPAPTGDCTDAVISLDLDGDGEFDDVLHALGETGPVLRVCLHDGTIREIDGMGQGEVLDIVDIGEDGSREIVYGSTTAFAMHVRLAVWVENRLLRVETADGAALELARGGDGTIDEEDGWSRYRFWGCADMDGDQRIDLVSGEGPRSGPDTYSFDLTGYTIEGATARPIASRLVESPAPDPVAPDDPYHCPLP